MRFLQQGRTLIELIIAMTMGLVIVIGVSSLYISSSGISRTANQVSTTEQAGQLAMLLIGKYLKLSAYGEILGSDYAAQGQTLMDGPHSEAVPEVRLPMRSRLTFRHRLRCPHPTLAARELQLGTRARRYQSRPVVAVMGCRRS